MMKHGIVKVITVGILLGTTAAAMGGMTATMLDTEGDPYRVIISAGSSFDVIVEVDTDVSLTALQLRLRETTDSPSGLFQLNSVSFNAPIWSDDSGDQYVPSLPALMDALSCKTDYFADIAGDLDYGTGTGAFHFVILNMTFTGPSTHAEYRLNLSDIVYGDLNLDEHAGMPGEDYIVVIPEPLSVLLIIGGLSVLGLRRRRG